MIDRDRLLKPRLPEEDYDIEGVGTIRIRQLSWRECVELQGTGDAKKVTAKVLSLALVDPVLSPEDVEVWMEAAPGGEIEALSRRITMWSGLREDAQKSGDKESRPG